MHIGYSANTIQIQATYTHGKAYPTPAGMPPKPAEKLKSISDHDLPEVTMYRIKEAI